jgi:hypothetical protein
MKGTIREYELVTQKVDSDGYSLMLMTGIVFNYRRKNEAAAVSKDDVTRRGQKRLGPSTTGWHLLVRWKDTS